MKNQTHKVGWIPQGQTPVFLEDMVESVKSDVKAVAPRYKQEI